MAIAGNFWDAIGHQLRCPSGRAGRVAGMLMSLVNRVPNRLAVEALQVQSNDTVLELGFGPGRAVQILASLAPDGFVFGIDASTEMLARASRLNASAVRRGQVQLRLGNFGHLPWTDSTFDKILAVNVVYFFDQEGQHLREILRVLKPGGLLSLYATDRETMSKWKFAAKDTHRLYEAGDLRDLLVTGGFPGGEVSIRKASLAPGVTGYVALARKSEQKEQLL